MSESFNISSDFNSVNLFYNRISENIKEYGDNLALQYLQKNVQYLNHADGTAFEKGEALTQEGVMDFFETHINSNPTNDKIIDIAEITEWANNEDNKASLLEFAKEIGASDKDSFIGDMIKAFKVLVNPNNASPVIEYDPSKESAVDFVDGQIEMKTKDAETQKTYIKHVADADNINIEEYEFKNGTDDSWFEKKNDDGTIEYIKVRTYKLEDGSKHTKIIHSTTYKTPEGETKAKARIFDFDPFGMYSEGGSMYGD